MQIRSVGREEAYIIYSAENKKLEFRAEIGRKRSIYIETPRELPNEELRNIVPSLAEGLAKLRYQYLIFRKREPQIISEDERNNAIAQLRHMGIEIEETVSHSQVQRAVVHNWPHSSTEQAKAMMSKVQDLMSKARGVREGIEILARSDSVVNRENRQ